MKKSVFLLVMTLTIVSSCTQAKLTVFRGVMKLFGGAYYSSSFVALNSPKFISAPEADYLPGSDEVIGILSGEEAKAYPLTMAFHHHIFNDSIGGKPILVTFCPLTHTAMVFNPVLKNGRRLTFRVDGLRESNMYMVDDSTQGEWLQVTGCAENRALKGEKLELLFAMHTTWALWKNLHPNSLVLSRDTGFDKDYSCFPWQERYFRYKKSTKFLFSTSFKDKRFHQKEILLGVIVNDVRKAYPLSNLPARGVVNDAVAGVPVVIFFDKRHETLTAFYRRYESNILNFNSNGAEENFVAGDDLKNRWNIEGLAIEGPMKGNRLTPVTAFKAFWFIWSILYPDTEIYSGSGPLSSNLQIGGLGR